MQVSLVGLPFIALTYPAVVNIPLMAMMLQSNRLLLWSDHHQLYHSDVLILPQGLIPGGESVVLNPPTGSSFNWVADVKAGTSLIFLMTDSQGRQGGSSDLMTVALSNDVSCLNATSPSSTTSVPSSTSSGVVTTSSGASPTSSQSTSSSSNVGAIAGTVVGCAIAIAALVTL